MYPESPVRQDQGFSVQIITQWECEGISSIISGGKTEVKRNKYMEIKEESHHQHFTCLWCITVVIVKKPTVVT